MSTRPTVIDFDDGGISVRLDGKDLRVWEYRDDSERRIKMLCAREYVEGWCVGNHRVPGAILEASPDADDCETICTPHGAHEILDQLRCALNDIEISAYNAARYRIERAIEDITIRVSPSFGKRA